MSGRASKRRKFSDDERSSSASNEFEGFDQSEPFSPGSSEHSASLRSYSSSRRSSSSDADSVFSKDVADGEEGTERGLLSKENSNAQIAKPSKRRPVAKGCLELKNYNGNLSKPELLKLQVTELLEQVRLPAPRSDNEIDTALRSLKKTIENIAGKTALSIADAESTLKARYNVAIPFPRPRPPKTALYKLGYEKPQNINVTGSYPFRLNTRLDETPTVDLVLTMPKNLLEEKDFLNYRFFYKRAYYLACVAAGIHDTTPNTYRLQYKYLNDNPNVPVVVVHTKNGEASNTVSSPKFKIQIMVAVAANTFPPRKTLPDRNCVRSGVDLDDASSQSIPTPFYNSSLRAQCTVNDYLKLFHGTAATCKGFRDACLLGRIWLRQRGLGGSMSKGGFGTFEWAAILALLLQNGPGSGRPSVSQQYGSFQLFKVMIQYLGSTDLLGQSDSVQSLNKNDTSVYPRFLDEKRQHNILYKMTAWSYHILKKEAQVALAMMLRDPITDHFESLFILRADALPLRFDLTVVISLRSLINNADNDEILSNYRNTCEKLFRVVKRGLGDRARLLAIQTSEIREWEIDVETTQLPDSLKLTVDVDATQATKAMDHGPLAENKEEAASFRRFWGEKAELRRFKDGSIMESLLWSTKSSFSSITEQIIDYLLKRHFGDKAARRVKFFGKESMEWMRLRMARNNSSLSDFQPLLESYNRLERNLRALEGLPLQIRHIFPASSQLSYSSLEVPLLLGGNERVEPASVIILFESSSQWPDDLLAVQSIKVAFLLKIGELLEDLLEDVNAQLGLENDITDLENKSFLDVSYDNGACFRIRIHHDRELELLERRLKNRDIRGREREETANALAAYKKLFLRRPRHTQYLQTLCTRYPSLSEAIRMLKDWFSSHLLSNHFPEELIELFAIHVYIHPLPWTAPSNALTALLRTLSLLSRWNWREEPFIADLDRSIDASTLAAIRTRYAAWRKLDPALNRVVMFVATPVDLDGIIWTDQAHPSKVVAMRMTSLARACSRLVEKQGLSLDFPTLFASPLTDYDFLIHLDPCYCFSRARSGKGSDISPSERLRYKNLALQRPSTEGEDVAVQHASYVDSLLKELNDFYGQVALFLRGATSSDVVAGLWVPNAVAKRGWKVHLGYSSVPCVSRKQGNASGMEGENLAEEAYLNKDAILNEISRLGGELINRIEVVKP